jgi:hypothetical protein
VTVHGQLIGGADSDDAGANDRYPHAVVPGITAINSKRNRFLFIFYA